MAWNICSIGNMATKYLNHELNFLGTENNETEEVYCVKNFQPLNLPLCVARFYCDRYLIWWCSKY